MSLCVLCVFSFVNVVNTVNPTSASEVQAKATPTSSSSCAHEPANRDVKPPLVVGSASLRVVSRAGCSGRRVGVALGRASSSSSSLGRTGTSSGVASSSRSVGVTLGRAGTSRGVGVAGSSSGVGIALGCSGGGVTSSSSGVAVALGRSGGGVGVTSSGGGALGSLLAGAGVGVASVGVGVASAGVGVTGGGARGVALLEGRVGGTGLDGRGLDGDAGDDAVLDLLGGGELLWGAVDLVCGDSDGEILLVLLDLGLDVLEGLGGGDLRGDVGLDVGVGLLDGEAAACDGCLC